jgi:hypothetical protein
VNEPIQLNVNDLLTILLAFVLIGASLVKRLRRAGK